MESPSAGSKFFFFAILFQSLSSCLCWKTQNIFCRVFMPKSGKTCPIYYLFVCGCIGVYGLFRRTIYLDSLLHMCLGFEFLSAERGSLYWKLHRKEFSVCSVFRRKKKKLWKNENNNVLLSTLFKQNMILEKESSIIVVVVVQCICITSFYCYFLFIFIFQQLVRIQIRFSFSSTHHFHTFVSRPFSLWAQVFPRITALKTRGKCYQIWNHFSARSKVEERQQIDFDNVFSPFSFSTPFVRTSYLLFAFTLEILFFYLVRFQLRFIQVGPLLSLYIFPITSFYLYIRSSLANGSEKVIAIAK